MSTATWYAPDARRAALPPVAQARHGARGTGSVAGTPRRAAGRVAWQARHDARRAAWQARQRLGGAQRIM